MKKLIIAAACIASAAGLWSCTAHGNNPGRAYMPDMYYSRAYETYNYNDVGGEYDTLVKRGITYNGLPVPGTVARGDMLSYHLAADSNSLKIAETLKNPLDSVADLKPGMVEAERLFLVNCAICHGPQLDGNGPLYNNGNGPYPAQPRPLNGDYAKALTDGHIFHVITYGIRTMGAYGSQLRPEQRWWVIKYIRMKQGGGGTGGKDTANVIPAKAKPAAGPVLKDTSAKK